MYIVSQSSDGSVTLSCTGATHEILYWHTYFLDPEAGARLAEALRTDGCEGTLPEMAEQIGLGVYVYIPSYLRGHNIPYRYTGGQKDDEDETEYEPVVWP